MRSWDYPFRVLVVPPARMVALHPRGYPREEYRHLVPRRPVSPRPSAHQYRVPTLLAFGSSSRFVSPLAYVLATACASSAECALRLGYGSSTAYGRALAYEYGAACVSQVVVGSARRYAA
jgi:hypothetical protein